MQAKKAFFIISLLSCAISLLEGDLERAEALFAPLKDDTRLGKAVRDNLRQIEAKRDEMNDAYR